MQWVLGQFLGRAWGLAHGEGPLPSRWRWSRPRQLFPRSNGSCTAYRRVLPGVVACADFLIFRLLFDGGIAVENRAPCEVGWLPPTAMVLPG